MRLTLLQVPCDTLLRPDTYDQTHSLLCLAFPSGPIRSVWCFKAFNQLKKWERRHCGVRIRKYKFIKPISLPSNLEKGETHSDDIVVGIHGVVDVSLLEWSFYV